MGAEQCFLFSHVENDTETRGDPWSLIRMDDGQLYCAVLTVRGMEDVRCTETLEAIHPRPGVDNAVCSVTSNTRLITITNNMNDAQFWSL